MSLKRHSMPPLATTRSHSAPSHGRELARNKRPTVSIGFIESSQGQRSCTRACQHAQPATALFSIARYVIQFVMAGRNRRWFEGKGVSTSSVSPPGPLSLSPTVRGMLSLSRLPSGMSALWS
jgi:hypothetical protein